MTPGFLRDEPANRVLIFKVLSRPRPDFAFYYASRPCNLVDSAGEFESFDNRGEVFAGIAVGAFVKIMEINFRHIERVG